MGQSSSADVRTLNVDLKLLMSCLKIIDAALSMICLPDLLGTVTTEESQKTSRM